MKAPEKKPICKLVGKDGNAFSIMGNVQASLKKAGADREYIDQYLQEAMSSDYDNLLAVSMNYVNVR